MKSWLIALGLIVSGSVLADGDIELEKDMYDRVLEDFYFSACGSYKDIGYSSQFGLREEYRDWYSYLGEFSATLESVRLIHADDVAFYKAELTKAKKIQTDVWQARTQWETSKGTALGRMKERDPVMFEAYEKMMEKTLLEAEDSYLYAQERAYTNISQSLSNLRTTEVGAKSSWYRYRECHVWWDYEKTNLTF
ncbi:hypothetical protein AB4254_08890 [Vibrio breoganii]